MAACVIGSLRSSCLATINIWRTRDDMESVTSSLAVLTAMITPAVLISASGTMILSTSTRLGRVVDRVRSLSDRLQELSRDGVDADFLEERRAMLFGQLDMLTSRSRLL